MGQRGMKRDIVFGPEHLIGGSLGLSETRQEALIEDLNAIASTGESYAGILEVLNDRGSLTDAEWVFVVFTLGFNMGQEAGDGGQE